VFFRGLFGLDVTVGFEETSFKRSGLTKNDTCCLARGAFVV